MKKLYGYRYGCFENRTRAKRLVSEMQHLIQEYGYVTVCDLHDLLGLETHYPMIRMGWTDLDGTHIHCTYHNGWIVEFSEPHIVDLPSSPVKHRSSRYPWVRRVSYKNYYEDDNRRKEFNEDKECNEEMIVYKKLKGIVHPRDIKVGDQIEVPLDNIGTFMATAHQITDEGILFIFDDCIARKPMNSNGKNKGGFEKSELAEWMQNTLYDAFPEELKKMLRYITLPSYGQMFGHDEWYEKAIMPDDDEQLPLMKIRKNRICTYENDNCWYWLRSSTKDYYSSDGFTGVATCGGATWSNANNDGGVRPAFLIG